MGRFIMITHFFENMLKTGINVVLPVTHGTVCRSHTCIWADQIVIVCVAQEPSPKRASVRKIRKLHMSRAQCGKSSSLAQLSNFVYALYSTWEPLHRLLLRLIHFNKNRYNVVLPTFVLRTCTLSKVIIILFKLAILASLFNYQMPR